MIPWPITSSVGESCSETEATAWDSCYSPQKTAKLAFFSRRLALTLELTSSSAPRTLPIRTTLITFGMHWLGTGQRFAVMSLAGPQRSEGSRLAMAWVSGTGWC